MTRTPNPTDPAAEVPRPRRGSRATSPQGDGAGAGVPHISPPVRDAGHQSPARKHRAGTFLAGQAPAGGAPSGSSALPAGTMGTLRTFKIHLPAGLKLLSLNGREHWSARARRAEELKKAAWAMALKEKIPRLERVTVIVEYRPPDRRRRDADNIAPSGKAALDGIVAAGCLAGDDRRYVRATACTIGEPFPRGQLTLYLIEEPPLVAADGAA